MGKTSVVRTYGPSWTSEDGGRKRSGLENAVNVLRAAQYRMIDWKEGKWERAEAADGLPKSVWVTVRQKEWPFVAVVEA
jgi:hypothetical protein